MPRLTFFLLFFYAFCCKSQPVTYSVPGSLFWAGTCPGADAEFTSSISEVFTYNPAPQYNLTGKYVISVQSYHSGTVDPTTNAITSAPFVTFLITRVDSPNLDLFTYINRACWRTEFVVNAQPLGSSANLLVLQQSPGGPRGVYLVNLAGGTSLGGGLGAGLPARQFLFDDNTPMPATVTVPIYFSRGSFTMTPQSIDITLPIGTSKSVEVGYTSTVPGATVVEFNDYYISHSLTTGPGSLPGRARLTVTPRAGLGTFVLFARFRIPGLPDQSVPLNITVTSDSVPLTVTPSSLLFTYTRGGPVPGQKQISFQSPFGMPLRFTNYDSAWLTLSAQNIQIDSNTLASIDLIPNMTTKSSGSHTTTIQVYNTAGKIADVPVSFYVLDNPGQLNITSQPNSGGTVEYTRNPENGTYSTITARAAPGFVFTRWSGAFSSVDNPATVFVLGNMNIVAEFTTTNGNCVYTVSPTRILAPAAGDVGRIDVQTQTGCPWSFTQLPTWMSFIGPSAGSGKGSVSYTVAANTGNASRQATLLGASAAVAVDQSGSGCATISAASPPSFSAAGNTQPISLSNAADCAFTPVPIDNWLTVTPPNPFQGNSIVNATAAANNAAAPRTTSVYLGGFRLPLLQAGAVFSSVFGDVYANTAFADYINILERSGIADLCATGFCPDSAATRAQMAEYIVHALYRAADFTNSATPWFTDVPATHPRFRWIQKLYELGVTTGCGGGKFCPDESLTRGQMATFVVRARAGINGSTTFPFRATGYFTDVLSTHQFFPFVQKLRDWGITAGCDATRFCPDSIVSRGQMAVFIVRGFLTP
ncbi:MAG: S-layer homology domain-containing protein [Acidobacteria bacterium]|nr:S-layer homology domain-containing protein [Acidobacteriota bacterium]